MRNFSATYLRANFAKVMKLAQQGEEIIIITRARRGKLAGLKFKLTHMPGKDDILPSSNIMKLFRPNALTRRKVTL